VQQRQHCLVLEVAESFAHHLRSLPIRVWPGRPSGSDNVSNDNTKNV
jgi:hypothetical protein